MERLTAERLTSWRQQIVQERMSWAESRITDKAQLDGYRAGIEQGMGEILNTLNLHGYLEVSPLRLRHTPEVVDGILPETSFGDGPWGERS